MSETINPVRTESDTGKVTLSGRWVQDQPLTVQAFALQFQQVLQSCDFICGRPQVVDGADGKEITFEVA
jgi:hypothetical protein